MIRNIQNESALTVLKGSNQVVILLRFARGEQYLEVKFKSVYTVLGLGLETKLSNFTTVSSKPTAWPPEKNVSLIT